MRLLILIGIISIISACSLNADTPSPTATTPVENVTPTSDAYFIAADANGVFQVWAFWLDGRMEQLTTWASSIDSFAVSPDESLIAFASGNALYLQQGADVQQIATLTAEGVKGQPDFNPDGKLLAYVDNGLYIMDLTTLEPRLVAANIEASFGAESMNMDEMRYLSLPEFVDDSTVQVEIGIWEGVVPGFVDLQTGTVQESERYTYTDMLIMDDSTLIVYSDTLRGAQPGLFAAERDNPGNVRQILPSGFTITESDEINYVVDAARVNADMVRVIVSWIAFSPDSQPQIAILDYTLSTQAINEILLTADATHPMLNMTGHQFSPDGRYVLGYRDASIADTAGGISELTGGLVIYRVATGQVFTLDTPIRQFTWND